MKRNKKKDIDIYERDGRGQIVGEKAEFRERPGHHIGRMGEFGSPGNGYILHSDGSYELAHSDQDRLQQINTQIDSVQHLMNSVWDHAEDRSRQLYAERLEWFRRICKLIYRDEDFFRASYNLGTGRLTFKAVDDAPVPPQPAPESPEGAK